MQTPASPTHTADLPQHVGSVAQLEELLSRPTSPALSGLRQLDGDLVILGVSGKMGPTLARMAVRALEQLGLPYKVYGVARFSRAGVQAELEAAGVTPVACDLLDRAALARLPDSRHVVFMAGQKFGTTGNQHMTWAINTHLPALVCERYNDAAIVAFSTGNVYPLTPVVEGGAQEHDDPQPVGEYAASCLGRERIFEYYSRTQGLRCAIMRLNYAVELRYGVLVDIASKVWTGQPVDVSMGAANVIWQGDANAQALGLLAHCATPPLVVNVTGPETVSVRRVAERFGRIFGVTPQLFGAESSTALLSNASRAQALFGYPTVALDQILVWIADWVQAGGTSLHKPTHFETRDGRF
ncbi:MAG: NAD(P)-dependent oxidoreductase [Caldilineaceae bacterium]|nr:NAD(P)-dependent oxidoreductase [Caldilineaceae bacterium]